MTQSSQATVSPTELLTKFEHLLHPIRDPQKNWTVDLVAELNSALEMLETSMIAFGQSGEKIIDFTKAAMIIQGSAHVYSKKVDHLYEAVYELRSWLSEINASSETGEGRKNRNGKRTRENLIDSLWDEDVDLDDVMADLIDEDGVDKTVMLRQDEEDMICKDGDILLPKIIDSTLFTPFNMKTQIINNLEEVIGNRTDFLLLNIRTITDFLHQAQTEPVHDNLLDSKMEAIPDDHIDGPTTGQPLEQLEQPADVPDNYYDDGGGGGDDDHTMNEDPVQDAPEALIRDQCMEDRQPQYNLRTHPVVDKIIQPAQKPSLTPHSWEELKMDEYLPSKRVSKKKIVGSTRRLPPSMLKKRTRKRNKDGKSTLVSHEPNIIDFCSKEHAQSTHNISDSLCPYPELKTLFNDELKFRQLEINKNKSRLKDSNGNLVGLEDGCQPDELGDLNGDHHDFGGDFGCDSDHDDLDEVPHSGLSGNPVPESSEPNSHDTSAYTQFIEKIQREYEERAHSERLSETDKKVKDWEKSVKAAVDEAESRCVFDMNVYSSQIFDSFSGDENTVLLDRVLENKPKHEAYRTFMSALILANHGNIDLDENPTTHQMEIKLINKTTLSDELLNKNLNIPPPT